MAIYPSEYSPEWQRKFALFPTYADNGESYVWLQHYWKRYRKLETPCPTCGNKVVAGNYEVTSKQPQGEATMTNIAETERLQSDRLEWLKGLLGDEGVVEALAKSMAHDNADICPDMKPEDYADEFWGDWADAAKAAIASILKSAGAA